MELDSGQTMQNELSNICFRDQNYLNVNALTKATVMQYFMLSGFFDQKSINKYCIDHSFDFIKQRVNLTGIEYSLVSVNKENDLFIIGKFYRKHTQSMPLGYFYIFKGTIYQAPDLYSVISSNIQSVSNNLINFINFLNNPNDN